MSKDDPAYAAASTPPHFRDVVTTPLFGTFAAPLLVALSALGLVAPPSLDLSSSWEKTREGLA